MKAKEVIVESVNLFEINMSPSSLRQLASGINARAGMEFEMYMPTTPFAVATKTNDKFVDDFDDVYVFFEEFNNSKTLYRVVDTLNYEYKEWVEKTFDSFFEKNKERYATIIAKKLTTHDASVIVRELTRGGMDLSSLDNIKDEKVKNKVIADYVIEYGIDPYYEDALDQAKRYYTFNGNENWLKSQGYTRMSDIAKAFGLIWPTVSSSASTAVILKNIGQSFSQSTGRKVNTSSSYHGADRNPNEYALEPDGSLNSPQETNDIGIEFVSPPLPVAEMISDLQKVKQWANQNNCYTNASTGLHINVSVAQQGNLDYVKLALLLGDEHVLRQFKRMGNIYTASAAKIVKNTAKDKIEWRSIVVPKLLDQMRGHLSDIASKAIHNGVTDKYVSIHPKDGYIEFRSPGGDWLDENFDLIENTLLRFVVALDAACDPEKYREEYLTKLYKILQPTSTNDPIAYFAKYAAGQLPTSALKSFIRQIQNTRKSQSATESDELEEGWKDWVAGAAIGAGVIGGGAYLSNKTVEPTPRPMVTGKVTQATPQQPNPMAKVVAKPAAKALISAAKKSGISGIELAQLLAQCAHESANFTQFKEQGGSLDFRKYDIKYNPRKAKILGNVKKGDGARYHGRGYIQLTGRDNYKQAGEALGLPLEARPELAEQPEIAARIAIWYWKNRVQPKVGDFSDTAEVTKPINAGLKGLDDRHDKFTDIIELMKGRTRS